VKAVVLALALAAGMLVMVIMLRDGADLRGDATDPHGSKATMTSRYGPEAVLQIAPSAAVRKAVAPQGFSPRASVLIQEYRVTRQLGGLFARLDAKTPRAPEESWLLAEILERCTRWPPPKAVSGVGPPPDREKTLRTFAESLSDKDPLRERRVEAFKTVTADRCEGVRPARPGETRELRQAAAAEGDAKARIRVILDEVMAPQAQPLPNSTPLPRDVARHLDGIRAAMESGEPNAIAHAANLLSLWSSNLSVRMGPEELPLNADLFRRAATVVGCELGANCGPGSDDMLYACAFHRACDIADLREYYFFHALSPSQSQLMTQYVEAIRAVVDSRDWSPFAMRPGVPTQGWSVNP
jgi:hypothetical protein